MWIVANSIDIIRTAKAPGIDSGIGRNHLF